MSLTLGQNVNYVNHIETGKMFPSMQMFFALCEYFEITPRDFFDAEDAPPAAN
jgi:transcriptional regulator with XRE-family HTH domain